MKISKTYRYLAYALITSLLLGLLCNFFYDRSPKQSLNIRAFAAELAKKENAADQTLKQLTQIINYKSVDSLSNYKFSDNDIFYFVFEKDELLFWSDNHIEPTEITTFDSIRWHYNKLSNAHCIAKSRITDSKILMAVILLKYNYPYENKDLINSYSKGFNLDKRIEIVEGNKNDKYAVSDKQNSYLFSLSNADTQIYSEFWGFTGFIFISALNAPATPDPVVGSRLRWHCRRGMRELDEVLARYLEREYPQASPAHRAAFERLLDMQDPEIFGYLVGRLAPEDPDLNHVVASLRRA